MTPDAAVAVETPLEPKPRDWTDELSDEERDRIIEKVAIGIVRRGMETPAILFLEMHKPVSFLASQSLVVISPFTAPFIGMENVQIASKLMEDRENIERLIRRIEELAVERDAKLANERKAAKAAIAAAKRQHKEEAGGSA
jgi:hypothetical protein